MLRDRGVEGEGSKSISELISGVAGLVALSLESVGGLGGSRIMENKDAGADDPLFSFRLATPLLLTLGDSAVCFLLAFAILGGGVRELIARACIVAVLTARLFTLWVAFVSLAAARVGVFCLFRGESITTIGCFLVTSDSSSGKSYTSGIPVVLHTVIGVCR